MPFLTVLLEVYPSLSMNHIILFYFLHSLCQSLKLPSLFMFFTHFSSSSSYFFVHKYVLKCHLPTPSSSPTVISFPTWETAFACPQCAGHRAGFARLSCAGILLNLHFKPSSPDICFLSPLEDLPLRQTA